ncbi:hypothetical protein O5817_27615, partial [Escherichia coli]|nr:hypothetical protein [Escherichia coli]
MFLLWGSHAQKKGAIIDKQRHHILKAPHPSPLSAHRGFFVTHINGQTQEAVLLFMPATTVEFIV